MLPIVACDLSLEPRCSLVVTLLLLTSKFSIFWTLRGTSLSEDYNLRRRDIILFPEASVGRNRNSTGKSWGHLSLVQQGVDPGGALGSVTGPEVHSGRLERTR